MDTEKALGRQSPPDFEHVRRYPMSALLPADYEIAETHHTAAVTTRTFCAGKMRYTKKEALSAINRRMRRYARNRPDKLRYYHCEDCNAYHLSHQPAYVDVNTTEDDLEPRRRRLK